MNLQKDIRKLRNKLSCLPWRILSKVKLYEDKGFPIKYITEDANWAIKTVGLNIKREIDIIYPEKMEILTNPSKIIKKIVHFGSQYMWLSWGAHMSKENKFISTFFHGKPEDGEDIKIHIEEFLKSVPRLSKVITSSSLVEQRLIYWGVEKEKVIKIPLGVNTKIFVPASKSKKDLIRKKLNIPKEAIVIGSFQKDGIGWESGLKPKLIKGPDILVETLKILSKKGFPIYALLTGPARGYVKQKLEDNKIPYFHSFVSKTEELVPFYQSLDIYLITSREEGGPMGLIESMACGVPVVSTKVGMAEDAIIDGVTGSISQEIDPYELSLKVENILNILQNRTSQFQTIRKETLKFDWEEIAEQHWQKVYKDLI